MFVNHCLAAIEVSRDGDDTASAACVRERLFQVIVAIFAFKVRWLSFCFFPQPFFCVHMHQKRNIFLCCCSQRYIVINITLLVHIRV